MGLMAGPKVASCDKFHPSFQPLDYPCEAPTRSPFYIASPRVVSGPRVLMEDLLPDIVAQILINLDVRDLIHCKSVCKSWKSLISSPSFIKSHLNHTYNNDRKNKEISDRRIIKASLSVCIKLFPCVSAAQFFEFHRFNILGSSNGLVFISTLYDELFLINPITREVKELKKPESRSMSKPFSWGFGYDSYTDDYKVVAGSRQGKDHTCFQILTLKSNVWNVVGKTKYKCICGYGVLCNGALHWFMRYDPLQKKRVILSFDLCKEEFREIPQPDGMCLQFLGDHKLGVMEECLCLYDSENIWIMKSYNVKESWELVDDDTEIMYDAIHCLRRLQYGVPHEWSFSCDDKWLCSSQEFIHLPIFVQSLVSPHVNSRLNRKQEEEASSSQEG